MINTGRLCGQRTPDDEDVAGTQGDGVERHLTERSGDVEVGFLDHVSQDPEVVGNLLGPIGL